MITGNTARVELRFTPAGKAVCNFAIADTPRRFNKETKQWDEQDTVWMNCTAFNDLAEKVAETFGDGGIAVVIGKLQARKWTGRDGQERTDTSILVDEIGASLRRDSVKINRVQRSSQQSRPARPAAEEGWPISSPGGQPTAPWDEAPF